VANILGGWKYGRGLLVIIGEMSNISEVSIELSINIFKKWRTPQLRKRVRPIANPTSLFA
jgi:hypothetical protein